MRVQKVSMNNELDLLRNELVEAEKKVKRLKTGVLFFSIYFVAVTLIYLIKNNLI